MRQLLIIAFLLFCVNETVLASLEFYVSGSSGYYASGGLYKINLQNGKAERLNHDGNDNFYYISRYDQNTLVSVENDLRHIILYNEQGNNIHEYNITMDIPTGFSSFQNDVYFSTFYGKIGKIDIGSGTITDFGYYYGRDTMNMAIRSNGNMYIINNYNSILQVGAGSVMSGYNYLYDLICGKNDYLFVDSGYHQIYAIDSNNQINLAFSDNNKNIYDIDYDPVEQTYYGFGMEDSIYKIWRLNFNESTETFSIATYYSGITDIPGYYSDFAVLNDFPIIPEPLSIVLFGLSLIPFIRKPLSIKF